MGLMGPHPEKKLYKVLIIDLLEYQNNIKASWVDGITAETFKLVIFTTDSPFGKSMLKLINKVWTTK
jgi:hypothetical protein